MNKPVTLLLLCMAMSMPALADPTSPAATPQAESADQKARREMLEKQKQLLDQMQLPPVQKQSDTPIMLDLPVDASDSPGATKK